MGAGSSTTRVERKWTGEIPSVFTNVFLTYFAKTFLQTRKCLDSWDKFTFATLQHSNGHHDAQEHQGSSASSQQPNGDHDDTTTDDDGESAAKRPRVKDEDEEEVEAPRAGEILALLDFF